jgi:hypothetical protein
MQASLRLRLQWQQNHKRGDQWAEAFGLANDGNHATCFQRREHHEG